MSGVIPKVDDNIVFSPAAERFAVEMEEARLIAKAPELFQRSSPGREKMNELCILRRWNSHTPSVWNAWGGGYFLRWRNNGTVMDPGCSFVRLFGKKPEIDKWTFSTNGVTINGIHDIPVIGFGPGNEIFAHAPNEKIPVDDLVKASAFYAYFCKIF